MRIRHLLVAAAAVALFACGDDDDAGVSTDETTMPDAGGTASIMLTPVGQPSADDLERTAMVIDQRLAALGLDDATVDTSTGALLIEVSGDVDAAAIADTLADRAELTFRPVRTVTPLDGGGGCGGGRFAQFDGPGDDPTACHDLGPSELDGSSVENAEALSVPIGAWTVALTILEGAPGIDTFNATASACFNRAASCPTGQLAIVLDDVVVSAPSINEPGFERDAISIVGDFSETEAKNLAIVLQTGALPVELEVTSVEGPG